MEDDCFILGDLDAWFVKFEHGDFAIQWSKNQEAIQQRLKNYDKDANVLDASME